MVLLIVDIKHACSYNLLTRLLPSDQYHAALFTTQPAVQSRAGCPWQSDLVIKLSPLQLAGLLPALSVIGLPSLQMLQEGD